MFRYRGPIAAMSSPISSECFPLPAGPPCRSSSGEGSGGGRGSSAADLQQSGMLVLLCWSSAVFVDIDGVLNVGAAEKGKSPTLLNDSNLRLAQSLWTKREGHPERHLVESLMAVSRKRLDGEKEALNTLVAKNRSYVSDVLVGRLAEILEAAGPRCLAVLASTWQAARHKTRLQDLEARLTRCLGRPFAFQATTGSSEEHTPDGRLIAIGNCMAELTSHGGVAAAAAEAGRLRALVLEDFFITALAGHWSVDGRAMDSPAAVEEYVCSRVPAPWTAQVRLIHTYAEWSTAEGVFVKCGVGLSQADVRRSKEFVAPNVADGVARAPKPSMAFFSLASAWFCSAPPPTSGASSSCPSTSSPSSSPSSDGHDTLHFAPL
ncbi:unnamed protein product [Prorocentrum cordatum]|uniref:Uncharacterized protein n=1 Tax=Prorocentrum cordatum TaxID=2364126 RepID=A0ABN9PKL3_9DINO|nr:unnamed protein product [Polarella glacialis]